MKRIVLTSLFSATLFVGAFGTAAFAEKVVPTDPSTPPVEAPTDPSTPVTPTEPTTSVEPSVDPGIPPVTPSEPTVPVEPEQPTEPSQPTVPSEPTEPVDQTEPSTTDTSDSTTDSSSKEQPTTASTSEEPVETPKEEPSKPTVVPKKETTQKENQPVTPAKEVTVPVDPAGEITTDPSQGTSVPIVTSDVKEISYVPTPATPLKAATGQTIVGVLDGTPLVQNEQGELVKDVAIPVKKLPSGNIEVKTADGQTKVLPKTGEEEHTALSVLGLILFSITTFLGYKKTKTF
ncbi:LPXTG cell wall anchor domain-containing protein [Enterococcus sp. AN402]|uniref:LPXTG cell wall anchor domain-containing protein n=1 Tax=Enterococcus sp. AN402 TaxID=3151386 RepID=UPI00345826B4